MLSAVVEHIHVSSIVLALIHILVLDDQAGQVDSTPSTWLKLVCLSAMVSDSNDRSVHCDPLSMY
jgi:hypothetical protein